MFVSVIVPCYNHAPYLKQRIESILNQTYQNFELILLDDVSPDKSAEILFSYKDHPKVSHCIINEKNSGSTFHQWNKGMQLAQGELIWIAESDDVADLSFLETLVEPFQQNPNLVLAYSQSHRMDSQGNITGTWKDYTDNLNSKKFEKDFIINGLDYINEFLIVKNTIPNASAVVFKKETYLSVNGANPNLKLIGDWAIWSKIAAQGDIFFYAKELNFFRYHELSVIAKAKKHQGNTSIRNQVIEFRLEMANYWDTLPQIKEYRSIRKNNQKHLFKEISRNSSLAIRKRHYKDIIPTTLRTMKACPAHLKLAVSIKLLLKLFFSICIDAPLRKIIMKK